MDFSENDVLFIQFGFLVELHVHLHNCNICVLYLATAADLAESHIEVKINVYDRFPLLHSLRIQTVVAGSRYSFVGFLLLFFLP
jgi:hypothetical protein